jgi:putative membrane protein
VFGPSLPERIVSFAIRWLILAVAVWVAAEIVPGIHLDGWESTVIVALILSLLNMFVKPLLVAISLPVTILTLGLFLIIINTAMLGLTAWIAGQMDDLRFDIDDFWAALVGAIIISIVSFVLGIFIDADKMARGLTRRVR